MKTFRAVIENAGRGGARRHLPFYVVPVFGRKGEATRRSRILRAIEKLKAAKKVAGSSPHASGGKE